MATQLPTSVSLRPVAPIFQGLVSGLANMPSNYVYDRVLPANPVASGSGQSTGAIFTIGADAFFGDLDRDRVRHPGTGYDQSKGFTASTTSYAIEEFGLEASIDMRQMEISQLNDLKGLHLAQLLEDLRLRRERRLQALLISANFTQTTPTDAWDLAASDPIGDISTVYDSIRDIGLTPNVMVAGPAADSALRNNPAILSFVGSNVDANILSDDALASKMSGWFNGMEYIVARAVGSNASVGQTAARATIFGDDVFIGHIDRAGSGAAMGGGDIAIQPTAVARFQELDFTAEEYDDNPKRSQVVRLREMADEIQVTVLLGQNLLATNP